MLLVHLRVFRILSMAAAGGRAGAKVASMFSNPGEYFPHSPYSAHLHRLIPRLHADPARASMLWERVWPDALEKIMDMVARCPELQGEVRVPRERPLLWDAAPGGNAFSICSAKKLSRLRPCPSRCKKTTNWAPSDVLIRTFMGKRMLSLRGIERSMHPSNASSRFAAPCMKVEQIAPALHEANNGECGDMRIVLEKQDAAELARSLVTAI